MSNIYTAARAAVRAQLAIDIADVDWVRDHWRIAGTDDLPRGGVATPQTRVSLGDIGGVDRAIELAVLMKREGGADLEDVLSADAATIETSALVALAAVDFVAAAELTEVRMACSDQANVSIGELVVGFRVEVLTETGDALVP